MPISIWNGWLIFSCICSIQNGPFQNWHQWPKFVHNIIYISPFVMVYGCLLSIQHNNQEMQGSVNSLSPWSVLKRPHRTTTVFFVLFFVVVFFFLNFLRPGKHNLQTGNVNIHQRHRRTMLGGQGLQPLVFWECSRVGWGEMVGQGECMRVVLGRPTGRVGELGEVGSPLAVEWLHTVIWG